MVTCPQQYSKYVHCHIRKCGKYWFSIVKSRTAGFAMKFVFTTLNKCLCFKRNKKRRGKRKISVGTVYEVKQDKYIHVYRAYWMQCIFVSLRLFRSVFLSNPAISSIFLNLPMPKGLGYLVAVSSEITSCECILVQSVLIRNITSNFQIW